ncbi:hypothetical protein BZA70DRAFT_290449 [Myxozyma melibiosi]|uniref:SGTA homodimerisation domain-containing protein n=1 Tax=Myxozyma melibiosi TaxID=54550 RepID=A0ABR1F3S2_9ASCO
MPSSKEDLALGIVDFLKTSMADGTIAEEDRDSVEVAVECLSEIFKVDLSRKQEVFPKQTLLSIFQAYEKVRDAQAARAASSTPAATSTPAPAAATPSTPTVSDEDKAKAEALKAEGNKFVASRDYEKAIDAYTKAIELDGTNKIYYSNRAAAYSASKAHDLAIKDAEKALEIDPKYAKAYSRLGLAKYASGDPQGAMEAYKAGMDAEGNGGSDAMRKGYETAKARVEEDLYSAVPEDSGVTERGTGGAAGAAGGMPDLSSLAGMFGGGGGMPDLSSLMSDPRISQMAQQFMSNPGALEGLMSNPSVRSMADRVRGGNMPSMQEMMNDPNIANLARNFMGGSGDNAEQ